MIRIVPWRGESGGWEVDIRLEGPNGERARKRKRSPVSSISGTRRWAEALERDLLAALIDPRARLRTKPSPTLRQFIPRFLEDAKAARQKPSTIAAKQSIIERHLLPLCGDVPLSEIGMPHAADLMSRLTDRSPKTVNNALSVLHRILAVAAQRKVIASAPAERWCLHYEAAERSFWEPEELDKLIETARRSPDPRELLVLLLGARAGLRLGEMKALSWTDVDLRRGFLTVRSSEWNGQVTETKGRMIGRIPLAKDLSAALSTARHLRSERVLADRRGRPLTTQNIRTIVARVERAAGLRQLGPHALRHTFCSHLAMRGVPARTIQELARHKDLKTTLGYMHLSPRALDDGIRSLEWDVRGDSRDSDRADNAK